MNKLNAIRALAAMLPPYKDYNTMPLDMEDTE